MENPVQEFYAAFQAMDAEKMASCYSPNVEFEDPAFGHLKGIRASNMWRMLVESQKGKDFRIEFKDISFDGTKGSAHWEAWYTFSQTGRKIHNIIEASFELENGKIVKHTDHFDLHRWARQAMGFKGLLIGGTRFFKRKLQSQTNRLLDKFESKIHP